MKVKDGPLSDLRVIELGHVIAAPMCGALLSDFGAEVIKIEKPGEGDWTRKGGPIPELAEQGLAPAFLTQNAGKKSVGLNLKTAEGLAVARELIAGADVFVENYKPGVAERLGLGFEALREINPRLVYCSISAYGQTGPLSPRPAYDHVIQGMCGIMLTTGKPGDGATKVGAPYVDYATGMNAAFAVLAGLREAERTGTAQQVDVAMLDTALMLMASLVTQHLTAGWQPAQNGNEAWSQSPSSGAFQTREPAERAKAAPALRAELEALFMTRTAAEWETLLETSGVPAARVRSLDEVVREDQFAARDLISEMQIAGYSAPVHVPNLPFKADGANRHPSQAPSSLGADTEAVLSGAGFDTAALARMRSMGVI